MTPSSINTSSKPMPQATTLSLLLHASAIGLLILAAWWSRRVHDDPPMPFELVAGPGDNYAALEAPAQPVTEPTVQLKLPDPPPVQERPKPQPKVETPPPQPKPQPQPREVKREPTPVKIEKAPEKPPVKVEPAPERLTFNDFVAENGKPTAKPVKQTAPAPIRTKSIDVSSVTNFTRVSTGAGGTAMTRQEVDLTRAYVQMIIDRVRESMERAGITEIRDASVEFTVTLTGAIENPQIARSSGSASFDRAVLAAFRTIRPAGKPPTGRAERFRANVNLSGG